MRSEYATNVEMLKGIHAAQQTPQQYRNVEQYNAERTAKHWVLYTAPLLAACVALAWAVGLL